MTSEFLHRPTAQNLVNSLSSALKHPEQQNLQQLSMNGSSVNWNVLDIVSEKRNEFEQLLIIGSFSQHVLHGVFKNDVTIIKWDFISRLILQLEETFTCVKEKLLYFR